MKYKYISIKKLADQLGITPLIALDLVLDRKYHYLNSEVNGWWVLMQDDEPMTCTQLDAKIHAYTIAK